MNKPLLDIPDHWRIPAIVAVAVFIGLLLLFHETSWSIVRIWQTSETYNHGFIILPISIWLLWEKRQRLAAAMPAPAISVLPLFLASGLAWSLVHMAGVQVVAQLALVAMLTTAVWMVLGHQATRYMLFPLLFLFLAVPMGKGLVTPMMEFTATFTVGMLKLSGIPVYREGLFFSVPTGDWSVVEACSGVRYIIASVTLGLLYAYLSYRTLWKRLLFVLVSLLLPILANGLRAYMIVMIGHLSDMKLAVGVDHLIYGWVFFGVVMLLLFWIGSRWVEPQQRTEPSTRGEVRALPATRWLMPVSLLFVASFSLQTGVGALLTATAVSTKPLAMPQQHAGWSRLVDNPWPWRPVTTGETQSELAVYEKGGERVGIFLALYPQQRQGQEVVHSANMVIDPESKRWRVLVHGRKAMSFAGEQLPVNSYAVGVVSGGTIGTRSLELVLRQWYMLGEQRTADPYLAKFHEIVNRIYPGRADGAYLVLATEKSWPAVNKDAVLQQFIDDMMPVIEQAISLAQGQG